MLLCLTINTRRKSLGHYTDEIETPNAYDWQDDSPVEIPHKKQWAGLDSNQRKLTLTGLQPVPFSLSGTDPIFIEPFYMLPTDVARRIPETSSWAKKTGRPVNQAPLGSSFWRC